MKKIDCNIQSENNNYVIENWQFFNENNKALFITILNSFKSITGCDSIYLGHSVNFENYEFMNTFRSIISQNFDMVYCYDDYSPSTMTFMQYYMHKHQISYALYITQLTDKKIQFAFYDASITHVEFLLNGNIVSTNAKGEVINIEPSEISNYIETLKFKVDGLKMDEVKLNISVSNEFDFAASQAFLDNSAIDGKVIIKKGGSGKKINRELNVYGGASLDQVIDEMRKNKANVGVNLEPNGLLAKVAVKHERRYKYLTQADISALLLNYHLGKLSRESKSNLENGVVVVSSLSFSLLTKIANSYGVETQIFDGDINELAANNSIKKNKRLLFATNEYGHILTNEYDKVNSLNQLAEIAAMAEYYFETTNENLYEKMQSFNKEYGVHRYKIEIKNLPQDKAERLITRIGKVSKVGDFEVEKVNFIESEQTTDKVARILTKSQNNFGIRINKQNTLITTESIGSKNQDMIDVVSFEKDVSDVIVDNIETFELKHFSWRTVFKYTIFTLIAIGILAFIFNLIYEETNNYTIWEQTKAIFLHEERIVWTFVWVNHMMNLFIGTWKRYRMMKFQRAKIKLHQMIVGNIMGAVISFLTPFTIGGDAIVYWYLRRKGVERGPLIASLMSSTVLYQAAIVIQTLFLFPFGFKIYFDIFSTLFESNPIQASAVLIAFIVGLVWNLFATFMILTLVMYRRFQEFIVKYTIIFLEWFKYTKLYDPGARAAKVQYEFREIRRGTKMLWKSPIFLFENLIYLLLPFFFRPHNIVLITMTDVYRTDLSGWQIYMGNMVIGDIISTSNSMSLTPGGAGTYEWLNKILNPYLMNPNYAHDIIPSLNSQEVISSMDLIWKIISAWPWLLFSAGLIITVIYGEASLERASEINKNNRLSGTNTTIRSHYYNYAVIFWTIIGIVFFSIITFYNF